MLQVDITLQLLEMGILDLRNESYYASLFPSAQPAIGDRPPADFLDSFVSIRAACPDVRPSASKSLCLLLSGRRSLQGNERLNQSPALLP